MFKGKTALVTGSTSGIGLGIARALLRDGANVILNGFGDAKDIETLRSGLATEHGVEVGYDGADLSRQDQIEAMMAKAIREFGAIDILVNNAGIQFVAPIDEFPVDKWNAVIAINLTASFHTVRLALPAMKVKKWGRVITIASAHALVASPFKAAYVAAKHGIAGLTKTVALEVAEAGITMNANCPGYVWTPLVQKQIPDTAKARGITEDQVIKDVLLAAQPTKKFVRIEEVAAFASFLASDAGASITGAVLPSKAAGRRICAGSQSRRSSLGKLSLAKSSKGEETRGMARRSGLALPVMPCWNAGWRSIGRVSGRRLPALHEAGIEPDWVIGTSIGAINGALIAGNEPKHRLERLHEFWHRVEQRAGVSGFDAIPALGTALAHMTTMTNGLAPFFSPNPKSWFGPHLQVGLEDAAYYTTAPLRETLSELVDLTISMIAIRG